MIADPALLLVDLQRDFCSPEGAHGADSTMRGPGRPAAAAENAATFLDRYRDSGRTPILIRTTHGDASTSPLWAEKYTDRPMTCRPGTDGAAFVPEIDVRPDDVVVTKHRYSAFHGTDLDLILRSNDISEVLIGGVATNICVESAVRDAFDHDYDVTVLQDCTGSTEPELREASLENIEAHFASVETSDAVPLDPVEDAVDS